jgi:hypothetical protein
MKSFSLTTEAKMILGPGFYSCPNQTAECSVFDWGEMWGSMGLFWRELEDLIFVTQLRWTTIYKTHRRRFRDCWLLWQQVSMSCTELVQYFNIQDGEFSHLKPFDFFSNIFFVTQRQRKSARSVHFEQNLDLDFLMS